MATKKPICNYSGEQKELQSGDAVFDVKHKAVTVESPTAAEDIAWFYTDVALTVTKVADAVKGSSPSVSWNIVFDSTADDASPTALFSSDRTTTSVSGATTTSFANASIPAGSWVRLKTSAQSGTVSHLHITITFTQ